MDGQTIGTSEAVGGQDPVDPWIAAFAALESKEPEASEADAGDEPPADGAAGADTGDAGRQQLPDQVEAGDGASDADASGGLDDTAGSDAGSGGFSDFYGLEGDAASIEEYEKQLDQSIREQSIKDIAAEFINRGVRNQNGKLGATINDDDICKRDADNVPHFYNPETGMEFRGDNPRRQAQEWCDDYNKELARVFNVACEQYEKHLRDEAAPQIAVRKFAETYKELDDIRRSMLDSVIEDYEIRDNDGKLIGYSCDLDKALATVNRQIGKIQEFAKQRAPQQAAPQPTGPALDMPANGGSSGEQGLVRSLAEAMEREQDKLLAKLRGK